MTKGHKLAAEIDARGQHDGGRPSPAALDRAADLKLSGGYKIRKTNLCPTCYTYRSANGVCAC